MALPPLVAFGDVNLVGMLCACALLVLIKRVESDTTLGCPQAFKIHLWPLWCRKGALRSSKSALVMFSGNSV
ncbi:MAG: hypothetical protein ACJASV_000489 [Pseudorhodobacter sp.]